MITYYTQQDIINFANFMQSDVRKQMLKEQGLSEDQIDALAGRAGLNDVQNWIRFSAAVERERAANRKTTESGDPEVKIQSKEEKNESESSK